VPTWNYRAAHASGRPRAVQDAEWLRALLRRMADRFDPEWGVQTPSSETARKHAAMRDA